MIARFLARIAMPKWLAEFLGIAALLVGLSLAAVWYRGHLIDIGEAQGVAKESKRRDAIDDENDRRAVAAKAAADAKVAALQGRLDATLASLDSKEKELSHEKAASAALQSDLAAGRRRLSVLLAAAPAPARDEQGQGGAAAGVDPDREPAIGTLDGRVASDLEWARASRNESLTALRACVAAYDAVKAAADAQP